MDKLEHSVFLMDKVLNSKIFSKKFPIIKRVEVKVSPSPSEDSTLYIGLVFNRSLFYYYMQRNEIHNFVRDIRRMVGIPYDINVHIVP
jgi:hypothetical protein